MREFFRGWRRNLGLVTLVIALVLMAGWIRSEAIGDDITFRIGKCGTEIRSEKSHITAIMTWARDEGRWLPENEWTTGFSPDGKSESMWERAGFLPNMWVHNDAGSTISTQRLLMFPYWLLVSSFSLLSGYLLLVKPRSAIPMKTSDPTPAEAS